MQEYNQHSFFFLLLLPQLFNMEKKDKCTVARVKVFYIFFFICIVRVNEMNTAATSKVHFKELLKFCGDGLYVSWRGNLTAKKQRHEIITNGINQRREKRARHHYNQHTINKMRIRYQHLRWAIINSKEKKQNQSEGKKVEKLPLCVIDKRKKMK